MEYIVVLSDCCLDLVLRKPAYLIGNTYSLDSLVVYLDLISSILIFCDRVLLMGIGQHAW